jgi:hypothetical protein
MFIGGEHVFEALCLAPVPAGGLLDTLAAF